MAVIGTEGDVTTRVGSTYDDTGAKAAEKGVASSTQKMQQQWGRLEKAQIKLGLTTRRQQMEMVQAYKTLKNSGVASMEELLLARQKLNTTLGKAPPLLQRIQKNWLKVAAVLFTIKKAWDLAGAAARFDQQEQAFTNLAASHGANARQIITNLKRISGQTISTAAATASAGKAMLLGIPAARLSKLMEIARASAKLTGQSVQQAFNDIAIGIGRQSPLILDNLGITIKLNKAYQDFALEEGKKISQLTDVERKQAFLNAALKSGKEIIDRVGKSNLDAADAMAIFTAKLDDARIFAGKVFISIAGAVSTIASGISTVVASFLGGIAIMASKVIGFLDKFLRLGDTFQPLSKALADFADFEFAAAVNAKDMAAASFNLTAALWKEKKAVDGLAQAQKELKVANNEALQKKLEATQKSFAELNELAITADLNEREREEFRDQQQLEKIASDRLLFEDSLLWNAELKAQFDLAGENAETIHQSNMTKIREAEAKRAADIEKKFNKIVVDMRFKAAGQIVGILRSLGSQSKAFAKVALIAEAAINIKRTLMSAETAAMAALTPPPIGLGPVAGIGLAASIRTMGGISAGLIGAQAAIDLSGVGSGGAAPGTPGGEPVQTTTAPATNVFAGPVPDAAGPSVNVIINLQGANVIGDKDIFVRDVIIPSLNEALGDGFDLNVST